MMALKDLYPIALITGASSGLGRAIAIALANEGVSLILTGRNQTALSQLSSYLRAKIDAHHFFHADLCTQMDKVLQNIYENTPNLIINSAGIGLYGEALTYSTDEQLKIPDVNDRALTQITLEGARAMRSKNKKGVILNISSVAGFYSFPSFSLYAASKAYVTALSKCLDEEFKPYNIRILSACPGRIATEFSKRAGRTKPNKSSRLVMTQELAASHILYQLKKKKSVYIFDWRYRWMHRLTKILPQKMFTKILQKGIEERIEKRAFVPIKNLSH